MNAIVRQIVINQLYPFTIMFVIHSSSSHNITSTQPVIHVPSCKHVFLKKIGF